jgi:cell division protein FtsL
MFENQDKNRNKEGNMKHDSNSSSNNRTGPPNEQVLNKKRYTVKLIEKRTGLLILAATLLFLSTSVYLIAQRNLYVYRNVWHILDLSKNVGSIELNNYKTIRSSIGFEALTDKLKRHKGIYGVQYSPSKEDLTVYVNDSIVTEDNLRKILHTKAKHAVAYPEDTNTRFFRYRLSINNYYDSFDGLILKYKLQTMNGVYFIESEYKKTLFVDIFAKQGLNVDSLKARIESPSVVMILKKKPTEVNTCYTINSVDVENADSQRSRILNKIFIKNSYESTEAIAAGTRLDTLTLTMRKFPIGRKLPFSFFLEDVEIEIFHIHSIKAKSSATGPELQIVFESKRPSDKEKLLLLLNRPSFTHMAKGEKRVVENPYVFVKKN